LGHGSAKAGHVGQSGGQRGATALMETR